MNKKFILLIVTLIFLLTACTNSSSDNEQDNQKVQSSTPLLEDTIVELEDFSFQLLDYYLVKSENDAVKDSVAIYEKISKTTVDSTKLGFDIGFHGSNSEVSKRDGYLLLTLNYNPNKNNTSQRDSVIPKMDISAVDNEGDDLILLHNSMDDKYIQVEDPIGILVFKIFGDIETIDFVFDGNMYKLELK
ncbi:hypothetical protein RBU61_04955 [Tissierella sp. MB52-C2]|uniref:hypothetical protein n=1 Tax=Tissierella sp. MB52-C2 TaxID=3070999 RepID=UPI00280AEE8F|nr:hypothetical protein [Tissierella sp. MB52-C2]WMM26026.1 hypothetical protein RBU61_04955 [Tissierella sp. MB52-C2]